MDALKRIYVCGLGALGGMYPSCFHDAGVEDLRIVVDADRARRYREEGVAVNGRRRPFTYLSPGDSVPAADLSVIGVKRQRVLVD